MKKRYSLYLTQELAERFELVARLRHGAKSALVEEALDRRPQPGASTRCSTSLLRRLDEQATEPRHRGARRRHRHRDAVAVRALLPHHHAAAAAERAGAGPRRSAGSASRCSSPRSAAASPPTSASSPRCWKRLPCTIPTCLRPADATTPPFKPRRDTGERPARRLKANGQHRRRRRRRPMADLFSFAAQEAQGRRRQMLRTAFGSDHRRRARRPHSDRGHGQSRRHGYGSTAPARDAPTPANASRPPRPSASSGWWRRTCAARSPTRRRSSPPSCPTAASASRA